MHSFYLLQNSILLSLNLFCLLYFHYHLLWCHHCYCHRQFHWHHGEPVLACSHMMRLMMMMVVVMMMVMVVMVMVVMISVVFMVEQCTHMSGNNAISCEKFTDASSPRSTFIIIVITTRENPPKETCLFWHLLILSNLIECGDFNMPFLLLRIERKHNLTHTHISHWRYI